MGKKGIKNSNAKIALENHRIWKMFSTINGKIKNSCERKRRPFYSFSDILFIRISSLQKVFVFDTISSGQLFHCQITLRDRAGSLGNSIAE